MADDDTWLDRRALINKSETADQQINAKSLHSPRQLRDRWTLLKLVFDVILIIPAICFVVYAFMVLASNGRPVLTRPVPMLRDFATFGPTIFPIIFAAVVANFLKALAAWKLERGISMLSLEFLLSSRTVFSTVVTPVAMRTVSLLTPLLIALWALSPLGGQAAYRIIDIQSSSTSADWSFGYLDFMSRYENTGPTSGSSIFPSVVNAFFSALSTPLKDASQDVYGNVKIPMIESYELASQSGADGWLEIGSTDKQYSSLIGIPVSGLEQGSNYSMTMETSYMYATCAAAAPVHMSLTEFTKYQATHYQYTDMNTMIISLGTWGHDVLSEEPLQLVFTSYHNNGTTNATCGLTTSYVEADITCVATNCTANRVRRALAPRYDVNLTVLDGIGQFEYPSVRLGIHNQLWFLSGLVNATRTPWDYLWTSRGSSALETYFTEPSKPFINNFTTVLKDQYNIYGAPVYLREVVPAAPPWTVGDRIFSQRFTQLLNTWWLANVAPYGVTGDFFLQAPSQSEAAYMTYKYNNGTAAAIPNEMVLRCDIAWFLVLLVASITMVVTGLISAIMGAARRGPDILDRASGLVRDNRFASNGHPQFSMQDGSDQVYYSKRVRLCLGDACSDEEVGYVALGSADLIKPMSQVSQQRLLK